MPNDLDIIKDHVLNGNTQAAYDHLMANYRNEDELRHGILTAINEDPDVIAHRDANPNESPLGGWGRGGEFAGGDQRRLDEHLAEQDRQSALAEQERLRQEQSSNNSTSAETTTTRPDNTNTQQSTYDSSTDELILSEEDQDIANQILERKNDLPTQGITADQIEQFILPDHLPETGGVSTPGLGGSDIISIIADEILESHPNSSMDAAEVAAAAVLTAITEDAEQKIKFINDLRDSTPNVGSISITGFVSEETLNQAIDFASKAGDFMEGADMIGSTVDIWRTSAQAHNLVNNMGNMSREDAINEMGGLIEQQMQNINELGGSYGLPDYMTTSIDLFIQNSDITGEFNDIVGTIESSEDFVHFAQLMQLPTEEAIPLLQDFAKDKANAAFMNAKSGLSDWANKKANQMGVAQDNLWRSIENRITLRKQEEAAEKQRQIQYTNQQKAILDNQQSLSSKKANQSWDSHIKDLKKEIANPLEKADVSVAKTETYLNILKSSASSLGDPDTYPTG